MTVCSDMKVNNDNLNFGVICPFNDIRITPYVGLSPECHCTTYLLSQQTQTTLSIFYSISKLSHKNHVHLKVNSNDISNG